VFLGVPVHVAPPVVVDSGLTDDGWIGVDPRTFATRFSDVFAAGDITSAPVPRVGVIAEGEAGAIADVLVHHIRGGDEPAPYGGQVRCYIEFGDGRVARFDADFLSGASPTSEFLGATVEMAASKREFGETRLARWFG
jgi:sulfide:quinone oxidoreductase